MDKNKVHYGYACINMSLQDINTNMRFRTLRKETLMNNSKGGIPKLSEIIKHNLKLTYDILKWNVTHGIDCYRMSSDIIPFQSYLDENSKPLYIIEELDEWEDILKMLKIIGEFSKKFNIRLTFHPGHYNCLASTTSKTIDKTISDLTCQAQLMDYMGLSKTHWNKINIHVGGSYLDKAGTAKRFRENLKYLPESVTKRLTVENDDRESLYCVEDLISIGIPIVFDSLHYDCNPGRLTYEESFMMAYSTWEDQIPVFHHSSSKQIEVERSLKRTHSDYIYSEFNSLGKEVYVMLESKKKDLALLEYIKKYSITL